MAGVGLALKALKAALMDFLISELCSVRLAACRAAFLADLIIGIIFPIYIKINNLRTIITLLSKKVKGKMGVWADLV